MMLDALACWDIAGGVKTSCSGGSHLRVPSASAKGGESVFIQRHIQRNFGYYASLLGQELV